MASQRFSWENPAKEEQDRDPEPGSKGQQGILRSSQPPQLQTQDTAQQNRFSFTETPVIRQGAAFEATAARPLTYIDEDAKSPQTPSSAAALPSREQRHLTGADSRSMPTSTVAYTLSSPSSPLSQDKKLPEPLELQHSAAPPLQDIHPAHFAPYADSHHSEQEAPMSSPYSPRFHSPPPPHLLSQTTQSPAQSQGNSRAQKSLSVQTQHTPVPPPMTYPPLPGSPVYQSMDRKPSTKLPAAADHDSPPLDFFHPDQNLFSNPAVPTSPRTPLYTPTASEFYGDQSRPGGWAAGAPPVPQLSHASQTSSSSPSWHASTMAPSRTCFAALACPCIVYGRVQYRLAQRQRKRQATDLLGYSSTNSDCMLCALACGLCGVMPAIQRIRTRRAYGIRGGPSKNNNGGDGGNNNNSSSSSSSPTTLLGDCLRGCVCCCCSIALAEREILLREKQQQPQRHHTQQYASPPLMTYPAPSELSSPLPPHSPR